MLELERRGAELSYVRTAEGLEVDFLTRYPDGSEELIQVCSELDSDQVRSREVRSLVAAGEHPRATLHLIGLEPDLTFELPDKVKFFPASAWLLGGALPTRK